jgi:hypothetical protein
LFIDDMSVAELAASVPVPVLVSKTFLDVLPEPAAA